jgi:hypothetical protein
VVVVVVAGMCYEWMKNNGNVRTDTVRGLDRGENWWDFQVGYRTVD